MGLDMYLTKKTYVGAQYAHRKVKLNIDLTIADKRVNVNPNKVSEITERAGYWRKANAIHNWFVENIQDGKDDCEEYYAPYEKLLELKNQCEKVLKSKDKASELLETKSGFFFGSTDYDDYYFSDIEETIRIIDSLDADGDYYYQSSW